MRNKRCHAGGGGGGGDGDGRALAAWRHMRADVVWSRLVGVGWGCWRGCCEKRGGVGGGGVGGRGEGDSSMKLKIYENKG